MQEILVDTYYEVSGQSKKNGEQKTFGKGESLYDVVLRACMKDPEWNRTEETAENLRKTFKRYEAAFKTAHAKVAKICAKRSGSGGGEAIPQEAQDIINGTKLYANFERYVKTRGYLAPAVIIESGDGGAGAATKKPDKRELLRAAEEYVCLSCRYHSFCHLSDVGVVYAGAGRPPVQPHRSGSWNWRWTCGRSAT